MTSPDQGNYCGADRANKVMEKLNNSYAQFRKKMGTLDPQASLSDVPKSSNNLNIPVQPDLGSIQLTAQLSTKSSTQVPEVELNEESRSADYKLIEDSKNKVFSGFVDKIKLAIERETDLKKIEAEYLKLEKQVLPGFHKLCMVQGTELVEEIDKAIEDLELKIHEHWELCSNQHALDIANVTTAVKTYEREFTEAIKVELTNYFVNSRPSSTYNMIERSKQKAEAEVVGVQDFGKFKSMFEQQINTTIEKVRTEVKIVKNLVKCFQNWVMTELSLYNCLSEVEFTKCISEPKIFAVKKFSEYKDTRFHSLLENLLTNTVEKLKQRNRTIRQCEEKLAMDAMQNVTEFYEIQMQNFCSKKCHSIRVLTEFHNILSRAAVDYFVSACNFDPLSGLSNEKYTAELQSSFQNLFNQFANQNASNVLQKKLMLFKLTCEAITEYRKVMREQLNGKSVSRIQLRQFHDRALDHVLTVFSLNIEEVVENCEEEVESLRSNINRKHFPDCEKNNTDIRELEAQKEAEEKAARERLLAEQEQARRDKVARIQAEKSRQNEARQKEEQKFDSITRQSENRNFDETIFQNTQSIGTAFDGVNIDPGNPPNSIAIELGLVYVRAGYVNSQGNPELIPLEDGRPLLPSFIGVDNHNIVFGEQARICSQRILLTDLVTQMKVTDERKLIINGKHVLLRLEHLTALLLTRVKQKCEEVLGSSVSRAIITIPSWYNQELRQATKHAAFLAGFVENRLISDASAVGIIAWYNHWQVQNQQLSAITKKLLVAVASEFSFDVVGIELATKSVSMTKSVGRMNVCLGRQNATLKKKYENWWTGSTVVDPGILLEKSKFTSGRELDQAIFVKSIGYESSLNPEGLKNYTKNPVSCIDTQIEGAILYSGPLRHLELKEVTTYSLICKDWTGDAWIFCQPNEYLCTSDSRRFSVDVTLTVLPSSVMFSVWEKVDDVEKFIASVNIEPPTENTEKLKLTFLINPEGILSVEAKYGSISPRLEFKTQNLNDLELVNAQELLAGLQQSEKKAKAEKRRQEVFQNMKIIEQWLRKSIVDSQKISSILKPEILKNVDKIVEGIVGSSSLVVIEDAAEKLTKYSHKYCEQW